MDRDERDENKEGKNNKNRKTNDNDKNQKNLEKKIKLVTKDKFLDEGRSIKNNWNRIVKFYN